MKVNLLEWVILVRDYFLLVFVVCVAAVVIALPVAGIVILVRSLGGEVDFNIVALILVGSATFALMARERWHNLMAYNNSTR